MKNSISQLKEKASFFNEAFRFYLKGFAVFDQIGADIAS